MLTYKPGVQASADPSEASEWAEAYLKSKTSEDRDKAESHVFGRSPMARVKAFVKAVKTSLSGVQKLEDLANNIDSDLTSEKDRIKKLNSRDTEKDSSEKTKSKRPQRQQSRQKSADYGPEL